MIRKDMIRKVDERGKGVILTSTDGIESIDEIQWCTSTLWFRFWFVRVRRVRRPGSGVGGSGGIRGAKKMWMSEDECE